MTDYVSAAVQVPNGIDDNDQQARLSISVQKIRGVRYLDIRIGDREYTFYPTPEQTTNLAEMFRGLKA